MTDTSPRRDIRAVVLDCDGVMFDTLNVNRKYYNLLLEKCGLPEMTEAQLAEVHMLTVDGSLHSLFDGKVAMGTVYEKRKEIDYADLFDFMEMEPHLKGLLASLRGRYKVGIATNRSDTMHALLAHYDLAECFDMVVTSLDVRRPKPFPDQLLKIADHFGILTSQILYVGDSRTDEKAAMAAGVFFVAYRNPELAADRHITSLSELDPVLDEACA